MNLKEVQELLKQISKLELAEFKMKTENLELSVRTKHYEKGRPQVIAAPAPIQMPAAPAAPVPPAAPVAPAAPESSKEPSPAKAAPAAKYLEIKSPIVGTFYRSPSPEKRTFLKGRRSSKAGDVVCIVEAMKLFNEIESEVSGTVVKVVTEDAQPVEYDQVLFLVDPN